ncbi:hypothetical protein CEXT_163521 [Caerostris extrusa]|uniref:Uncharacterized protein n=1 Tax=Caerostris extrusa TaxID=172846 RepID=A0AAV4RPC6_CAEEX|nr:hypothetical protein CEXT_163521 [Caerostris extrusa]
MWPLGGFIEMPNKQFAAVYVGPFHFRQAPCSLKLVSDKKEIGNRLVFLFLLHPPPPFLRLLVCVRQIWDLQQDVPHLDMESPSGGRKKKSCKKERKFQIRSLLGTPIASRQRVEFVYDFFYSEIYLF